MVNTLNRIRMVRRSSALACLAMTFGSGCAARVYSEPAPGGVYPSTVEDDGIVYVETVPPNIEAYPHYVYGGGDAYYVEGRWYRRGPRGWGYYRQEPPQLARQRPTVVVQAPSPAPPPAMRREGSDAERGPAAPRERQQERQVPAHDARDGRHEQAPDRERAPAPAVPRARSHEEEAPAARVRSQGAADAPSRPDEKRPAPRKENER